MDVTFKEWYESITPELKVLIEHYPGKRDPSVFFRSFRGSTYLMLNTVPSQLRPLCATVSTIGIIINVFLDDYADQYSRLDLVDATRAYFQHNTKVSQKELQYLEEIWGKYWEILDEFAPSIGIIKNLLKKEWLKFCDALTYSIEVNLRKRKHTLNEALAMESTNMLHVHKHIIDLAFSMRIEKEDINLILEFANKAENVTRIGNWLKSWEAEISQLERGLVRDITSGVLACALDFEIITEEELFTMDSIRLIDTIKKTIIPSVGKNSIDYMFSLAMDLIKEIRVADIPSKYISTNKYAEALEQVLQEQLNSSSESR